MKPISKPASAGNATGLPDGLPLFDWAKHCPPKSFPEIPRAVRVVARRFRLSPVRARIVAELAGFNLEAQRYG